MDNNLGNALKGMSPSDLPDVVCDKCGNPTFRQVVLLKKVSAALSFTRSFVFILLALMILPRLFDINGAWLAIPTAEFIALATSSSS